MAEPDPTFWTGKPVVVTGGAGFVGRVVVRHAEALGAEVRVIRSAQHDLRDATAARDAVDGAEIVIHLAANVGGIGYNRRNPAPLVYDNMAITSNVFEQSRVAGAAKLVAACTVCAYPKLVDAPFKEADLWNGYPEETNAPYGLAKKMMLVLSDAYRRQYGFDSCAPSDRAWRCLVRPFTRHGPQGAARPAPAGLFGDAGGAQTSAVERPWSYARAQVHVAPAVSAGQGDREHRAGREHSIGRAPYTIAS